MVSTDGSEKMELSPTLLRKLSLMQKSEITGHHIYNRIARLLSDEHNRKVIHHLAADELGHYRILKKYTQLEVAPNWLVIWFDVLAARLLGFTFVIKLLERGEGHAQGVYAEIIEDIPEIAPILANEEEHEEKLLEMLDEERLRYTGAIVLGLNDALVELTGALAGLTLALQNTQLIALSGLITGISASISMAASEYLSIRAEDTTKKPLRAAIYTGITYILTVALLILPYLLLENYLLCLLITLVVAVMIIAGFNFYISVAKDENFLHRFTEMTVVSLGVAMLSFGIGFLVRQFLGVDV